MRSSAYIHDCLSKEPLFKDMIFLMLKLKEELRLSMNLDLHNLLGIYNYFFMESLRFLLLLIDHRIVHEYPLQ